MNEALTTKVDETVDQLRLIWKKVRDKRPFVAFSTGKDSLLVAALLYEAVGEERPQCLYSHHNLEFDCNKTYLETLRTTFNVETVEPFLGYFDLIERGIGFLTLKDPWCVPMLVGTGILEWLQKSGAKSPMECVMFRGMSGTEFSHKWHSRVEIYERLNLPTVNPILHFTKEEILEVLKERYDLPLNPIYEHMDRTYCICCYTSDAKRQCYSAEHHPDVCSRYYGHIEQLLFDSGLIEKTRLEEKYKTKEEKLDRHGFIYWNRINAQNVIGAVKRKTVSGAITYHIRDESWINEKHLAPLDGHWLRNGNQIRFWGVPEAKSDCVIKRMLNCLDCGFCVVQCFAARKFNRETKTLELTGCRKCGQCINLKHCMGWKHRFWRRVLIEE